MAYLKKLGFVPDSALPDSSSVVDTPSEQFVAGSQAGTFPYFDWLRFALASAVALDHSGWHLGISGLAVQVFFALSGWLIGGILLKTDRSGLPAFYYKRATRIWPPYVAAIVALYAVAAFRDGFTPGYFGYLLHDVTFTYNWFVDFMSERQQMPLEGTAGHFWTISVEEQFYLAAPLLMVAFGWGKRLAPWLLIAALGFATAAFGFQYLSIVLGVVAAIIYRDFGDWHTGKWARATLLALGLTTLTVILAGGYLVGTVYAVLGPIFSICVVLLTAIGGKRSRLGEMFGGISYPLYLNHWMGLFAANYLAKKLALPDPVKVTLAYGGAVAAGYIAYRLIDLPVMQRRNGFYTLARGKALMTTAYVLCGTGVVVGLMI